MDNHWEKFSAMLKDEEGWSLDRVRWRVEFLLNGFDINNKRILDVGCGRGTYAIYLAIAGGRHVVGIDPEGAGSCRCIKCIMPQRIGKLGLTNCEFFPVAFREYPFPDGNFDLILSYNSINHLHEVTSDLRQDATAYSVYHNIFAEFFRITRDGGMIILADCSRRNLFSVFRKQGIPHPIPGMRMIEWEKHQIPSVWKQLLQKTGFTVVSQSWYVPAPFRYIRWLMDNPVFSFCTFSHFALRARRPSESIKE